MFSYGRCETYWRSVMRRCPVMDTSNRCQCSAATSQDRRTTRTTRAVPIPCSLVRRDQRWRTCCRRQRWVATTTDAVAAAAAAAAAAAGCNRCSSSAGYQPVNRWTGWRTLHLGSSPSRNPARRGGKRKAAGAAAARRTVAGARCSRPPCHCRPARGTTPPPRQRYQVHGTASYHHRFDPHCRHRRRSDALRVQHIGLLSNVHVVQSVVVYNKLWKQKLILKK